MSYAPELIEKVARAIAGFQGPEDWWTLYESEAISALDAMGFHEETRNEGKWIHPDAYRLEHDQRRYVTEWLDA